jgi:hypothetical protein
MKDVFITSTLKAEWNRKFNPLLCEKLEEHGVKCYLPQRNTDQEAELAEKYEQNTQGIRDSKKLISVGVNESINWGIETGYAYGLGKEVILVTEKDHFIPVMSRGMYKRVFEVEDLEDFDSYIADLAEEVLKV